MFRHLFVTVMVCASLLATPSAAVTPEEVLDDPKLEERARALSLGLRCMVCQNQSIDDSDAPLAKDLRILVRERLVAGDTDDEVIDYLVDRYGEFVLLKPRFAWHNLFLWAAGPLALLAGLVFIFLTLRKRRENQVEEKVEKLSDSENERLQELLSQKD